MVRTTAGTLVDVWWVSFQHVWSSLTCLCRQKQQLKFGRNINENLTMYSTHHLLSTVLYCTVYSHSLLIYLIVIYQRPLKPVVVAFVQRYSTAAFSVFPLYCSLGIISVFFQRFFFFFQLNLFIVAQVSCLSISFYNNS